MGTHPIFESDFDCLTECSLVTSLKSLPHNDVFPSASAVWLKVASPNHPTSISTILVRVWTPTSPVQPWKTSLPPATKPIVSPKSEILPPGMINKWLIRKQLKKLSRLTHVTDHSLSPSLVVVIRNHGLPKMHLKPVTTLLTSGESKWSDTKNSTFHTHQDLKPAQFWELGFSSSAFAKVFGFSSSVATVPHPAPTHQEFQNSKQKKEIVI